MQRDKRNKHECINKHVCCSYVVEPWEYTSDSMRSIGSFYTVDVWAGGNVDWKTLDCEILCGYFGLQSDSIPSNACQKPYFFNNPESILKGMLLLREVAYWILTEDSWGRNIEAQIWLLFFFSTWQCTQWKDTKLQDDPGGHCKWVFFNQLLELPVWVLLPKLLKPFLLDQWHGTVISD